MKIHELPLKSHKAKKRLGRGIGSGQGKTAGRGTKGQNSRTGGGVRVGFEGGQTQLSQRLPKVRGFKSKNPTNYQVVNVGDLARYKAGVVDGAKLAADGLVKKADGLIKLLSVGEVTVAYTVEVTAASQVAIKKIEKAGGKVVLAAKKAQKPVAKAQDSEDAK
jgi:large subunit ribosomal protein L15